MASYARLILEGREDAGVDSGYDRYERPERWPSLPSRGVANEKAERLNEVEEQIPVDNENGNNNRYNMNTDTEEFFIERIVEKVMLALETETRVG
ncbi:PREDICTED: uncharacterized protein LOC108766834 isoform X4 [Trachymyrmex cornetzi]|uniref:uncharacterized protein LOC108766834 isoform X4 n=1 Tax=Trachymyrmex cornetzi TaxID=471704 RepID=UPI00084F54C0|nr:PREDICTED: uncharacterized protein LOC108766834 isoform X4 [Trachymyrmex cornetzi]